MFLPIWKEHFLFTSFVANNCAPASPRTLKSARASLRPYFHPTHHFFATFRPTGVRMEREIILASLRAHAYPHIKPIFSTSHQPQATGHPPPSALIFILTLSLPPGYNLHFLNINFSPANARTTIDIGLRSLGCLPYAIHMSPLQVGCPISCAAF